MNAPLEEWHLDTRRIGRRVLVFESLESTNTLAASLAADPGHDGIVVIAESQSAGRGQHGRSWTSPPGTGVLLSALLFPPPELRRPVILAALAAVAVCQTIERAIQLQATIKWPNDVLIRGRKVCGILIEQGRGTVLGIGLNVNQTPAMFAAAGLPQADSLANAGGYFLQTAEVARLLIAALDEEYDRLTKGDRRSLEMDWQSRTGLLGEQVTVECHAAVRRGRLLEMTWSGLRLEGVKGTVTHLQPEAVKHITLARESGSGEPPG